MVNRNEAVVFGITNFLAHHPKEVRRWKSNNFTHLGVLALDEAITPQGIKVGTIGNPTIRSSSRYKKVEGDVLAAYITAPKSNDSDKRQLWIPTFEASQHIFHRYLAEIVATEENIMLDGWIAAQPALEAESDHDQATKLLEEAKGYLMTIGAMTIEAGYRVTPLNSELPPIPEFLRGRQ